MNSFKPLLLFSIAMLLAFSLVFGMETAFAMGDVRRPQPPIIEEESNPEMTIKEGYISQKKESIKVIRNGRVVAKIKLGEPVMVAQAEQEEKWGYFQFPGIGRTEDGRLIVSWQMSEDSHKAYGKGKSCYRMSNDEGKTWIPRDREYFTISGRMLRLRNGNILQVATPTSKDVSGYPSFPTPEYRDTIMKMDYYLESDLPDDLRGMYLCLRDSTGKRIKSFQGKLEDTGLLRYAISGLLPIKWWGDMKELADGSLIVGIYPSCYLKQKNELPKSDVTFYKSVDEGCHWKKIGSIPFSIDKIKDPKRQYDRYQGFSEACFEILRDCTFFCVMRSGYNTPMYKSFSYDKGHTWMIPEAFTPNGVKPRMLQLDNGVLVLASGRPGLQLRFCLDGDGKTWTEPIEMLPFMDENGNYDMWAVSCGYPRLLQVGNNTFYMVYSDFRTQNEHGEIRKSIIFRKITIVK